MTFRWKQLLAFVAVAALVAAGCASEEPADTGGAGNGTGAPEEQDLLARILDEGVIRVSTDPAYPPASFLNEETDEWEGFDVDVATEIARRLGDGEGVEVEWITPSWNAIISGGWNDRWDMSVGSMTVTAERAEVLDFAPAYYYTPSSVAVHADNSSIQDLETDLDGKRIGVCGGCTYDFFLQQTLDIPGYTPNYIIDDPQIETYDTDSTAIQDLALGDGVRLDAAISSTPIIQGAIDKGRPIKIVGDPVFAEPLAVAFDKSAPLDNASLVEAVGAIIEEMHGDGTLSALSVQWFGEDLTQEA